MASPTIWLHLRCRKSFCLPHSGTSKLVCCQPVPQSQVKHGRRGPKSGAEDHRRRAGSSRHLILRFHPRGGPVLVASPADGPLHIRPISLANQRSMHAVQRCSTATMNLHAKPHSAVRRHQPGSAFYAAEIPRAPSWRMHPAVDVRQVLGGGTPFGACGTQSADCAAGRRAAPSYPSMWLLSLWLPMNMCRRSSTGGS